MKWINGEKVTSEVAKTMVPKGWSGLIERLVADLDAMCWDGTVMQIKEKFAELRFYTDWQDELVEQRVQEAVEESRTSCQACGSPGKPLIRHGWIFVACEDHSEPAE